MSTAPTTTPRLSTASSPAGALLHHRTLGPADTGIVHLGLGNFHRAHQAVYTAAALTREDGQWGVLGVAGRSADVADALRAQDLRYTVAEVSPAGLRCAIPAVHTGALVAAREPEPVQRALASPGTRVISLTVTEHGYTYSPAPAASTWTTPASGRTCAATAPRPAPPWAASCAPSRSGPTATAPR
ncbi:hypothetical protein [Streptomyces sp. CA-132043]|uniref:hypothetical protein n=1 Tax=Streptomyces sp. CA-132043 TaxID=3240048 RepID=UPI003D937464